MAKFAIRARRLKTGAETTFLYDNLASTLTDAAGVAVPVKSAYTREHGPAGALAGVSPGHPGHKGQPGVLKVQLGLACNYSCSYCSQRFVPHAEGTGPADIEAFLAQLTAGVDLGAVARIEFWGGEPLVYWKTLRPLAEALRARAPQAVFSIITNGALIDATKAEWLVRLGFTVAVSHDGPGQGARGPDPLAVPATRAAILALYATLAPEGRFSFNAMLHGANTSRAAVIEYFRALTGDAQVRLGEGGFIDPYDAGGLALSLEGDAARSYLIGAWQEIRSGAAAGMPRVRERIGELVESIAHGRPASSLGQKCGMDRADHLAVDLKGRVLTCQNVSAAAVAPNGNAHHIGELSDLAGVRLDTATHFAHRPECRKCVVLQTCKGSCMFLEGPLWEAACDNSYADHMAHFLVAFEFMTGHVPVYIGGPQRADRHEIFGSPTRKSSPARSVIPIAAVS